jgi:beta-lactam-binding protein with PASTA domain
MPVLPMPDASWYRIKRITQNKTLTNMSRSLNLLTFFSFILLFLVSSCNSPKMLFSVADGKQLDDESEQVLVNRDNKDLPGKKNLKLKKGDVIQIKDGVDGTGVRSFQTVSTVHGPATLVVTKDYLEQQNGTVMHNARSGKLLIPGMSIDHEGASYVVAIEEKTIDIVVFDGEILVSSTETPPPWKPFFVESRERRKIWRDGRLAPNQPQRPNDLNQWIDAENQLLKAGNSSSRMVPSVVTLPSEDAKGLVASANFPLTLKFTEEGSGELGTITKQDPAAGKRVSASQNVSIFERSRIVEVPNVFKLSPGKAISVLQDAGLKGVESERTITRSVDPNYVNSQNPVAGTFAAEGSTVSLTVEAVSIQVPNVIGMSTDNASRTLGELKLEVSATDYDLNHTGDPKVLSQEPVANTFAIPGSVVKVRLIAKGFKVPKITGMTDLDAKKALSNNGFPVGNIKEKKSSKVAKGLVISQSPAAGAASGKEVPVDYVISKGN